MATMRLLIFAAVLACVFALPQQPPTARNTIFGDEKLEGQIFENLQYQTDEIETRNVAASAYRLPTTTKPEEYDIFWNINPNTLQFSGEVTIYLYATQPNVREIVIHSQDLTINSVSLQHNGEDISQTYYLDPAFDFLYVQLSNDTLEFNTTNRIYELTIQFAAPLRNDMYGLYYSWFRNENPDESPKYMATTQFQATSARKAFPCYDEPSFKATFHITVRRPDTHNSWSCTRINTTLDVNDNLRDDVYYPTPVMSTYLLAVIVAEYQSVNTTNSEGLLDYEVIGRPAAFADNQEQYALDVGRELLDEMSDHTAMDFFGVHPYIKMTQAAIPDFSAGAMENWGLLTYREAYLMYNSNHTNSNYKQLIAYILSHEIAHMWFGNLVTCEWWDVLWLNEGFARYYQYFLTHAVEDYMGLDIRFITEQVHASLLSDSVASAHPLSHSGIGSQASASSMFSTITYNKGAAVIRMTEHLLGYYVHREGLRNYLQNRKFDVALPIHLFQELQDVAVSNGSIEQYGPDFSVIDYYRSWTEQGGHPVLNVQVNHQTGEMLISQQRFDINTGYGTALRNWIIPITFATASNPNFNDTKPTHIISDGISIINRGSVGDEWVIFNKQQTGFYRINYDDYTWDLIALALRNNRNVIHEYNRAQIVNDVFQYARAGIMTYSRALNILSFLQNETAYTPWVAAITAFNWLRNRLASTEHLADLENLIIDWSETVIEDLSYYPNENEDFMRSYLRLQLAPTLCAINAPGCREAAREQFDRLLSSDGDYEVPVDSRTWVYCNALRNGTYSDFEYLWERFRTHHVYTEKIVILSALGCTSNETAVYELLAYILEENYLIRRQDYSTAFNSAVSGNEENTQIVFRYIQENLEKVEAAYNVTSSLITPLSAVSSRLRTEEEINEFQEWARANRHALGASFDSIVRGAEDTRNSIFWTAEVQDDILNYLVNEGEVIETSTASTTVSTGPPATVTAPSLVEPITPELPDSAVTTALSVSIIVLVAIANFAL
ncbi:membrane alanyl aminopeptidase-like [Aphomia sociella]